MKSLDSIAISPLIALAGTALVTLATITLRRPRAAMATIVGLGVSLALHGWAARATPCPLGPLLLIDGYGLLLSAALTTSTLFIAVLYRESLANHPDEGLEFYVLLVLATLGASVLAFSRHLVGFFLGLELLSVSLYGLIAYPRSDERSLLAALKYLILNSASSAFLLLGIALTYSASGTMEFEGCLRAPPEARALVAAGAALMTIGVGFKLAWVPFHFWSPEVYQDSPVLVTAFLATVSKGAVWAGLIRFLLAARVASNCAAGQAALVLAVLSMTEETFWRSSREI